MKRIKKILASLMVVVMVLTAAPLSGFVGLELNLDWLSFDWFDLAPKVSAESSTGSCGDNLIWIFDESSGTLTIKGSGDMWEDISITSMWYSLRSKIKTVYIPKGITSFIDDAFLYCYYIQNVYYEGDLNQWCRIDFADYDSTPMAYAKNLYIDNTLVKSSLVIPEDITVIKNYTFYGWNQVTDITMSAKVTSVGKQALYGEGLERIIVDEENPLYSNDEYGVLFNKDKTVLIQYPAGRTTWNYTIPDTVTTIATGAFYYCDYLSALTIPDSVTTMEERAFTVYYLDYAYYPGTKEQWGAKTVGENNSTLVKVLIYECNSDRPYWNSGSLGENVEWIVYKTNELEIFGTGEIPEFTSGSCPWISYKYDIVSLTIGDGITKIGNRVFEKYDKLYTVTIGNDVENIGDYAFYNCENLYTLMIGNGVTSIGDHAFDGCVDISKLTIGNSVKNIGDYAFYNCEFLTDVIIPDGVTSIGKYAFYCFRLQNITLPASIKSIGEYAFDRCTWIENIYYKGTFEDWCKINFANSYSNPNCCRSDSNFYIDGILVSGTFTFPRSIKRVNAHAFFDYDNITAVYYTGTLADWCAIEFGSASANPMISVGAVYIDNKLVEGDIVIPDGVESIGAHAFINRYYMSSITIPDSVKNIGEGVFSGCGLLKSVVIPNGTTSIGDRMFYECQNLENVTVPDSVTSIGDAAFAMCFRLKNLQLPENITSIGMDAFFESGYYRQYVSSSSLVYIGNYLIFAGKYITSANIKRGTTVIADGAFYACLSLENVTIPDSVIYLGKELFVGCDKITEVIIPKGITDIREGTFCDCLGLESVVIPDSVTSIEDRAFYNCISLVSLTLSDSITTIGKNAFYGVDKRTDFYFQGSKEQWNAISIDPTGNEVFSQATIVFLSVEGSCGENIFWHFNTQSGELKIYGNGAMKDYTYYSYDNTVDSPWYAYAADITSLVIEKGVKSIGKCAFRNCENLEDVLLPSGIVSVGSEAFYNTSLYRWSTYWENDVLYIGEYLICAKKMSGDYKIKEGTKLVADCAFNFCYDLDSIIFPDGLVSIGVCAFQTCYRLKNIEIPDSVVSIGAGAFNDCFNLRGIEVDEDNLYYCNDSDGVLYNKDRTELVQYPAGNPKTDFIIPNGVVSICDMAFDNSDISSVVIPDSVIDIGKSAFYGCGELKSVVIPDSVETIGEDAFFACNKITRITIPNSVKEIGSYALYSSVSLIYFMGTEEEWLSIGYDDWRNAVPRIIFVNEHDDTDHIYDEFVVLQPNCATMGEKRFECFCGNRYTKEIATLEHILRVVIAEPTATVDGYRKVECSRCYSVLENKVIPATGFETLESVTIDFATNTISGFNAGETSLDNYTTIVNSGYVWEYETQNGRLGTDTKAILKDGNMVIGEYTILVYGDTNGDSWYDGQDAIIVDCLANGMLTKEAVGEAVYLAADCNHDGVIDQLDIDLLNQAGTLLANVDQSKTAEVLIETSSEYVEYISSIDQTPEVEVETVVPKVDTETEDAMPEQDNAKVSFFDMILNILKTIIETIISYNPALLK